MPIPNIIASKDTYEVGQTLRLGNGKLSTVIAKAESGDHWAYWTRETEPPPPPPLGRIARLKAWFLRHKQTLLLIWNSAKYIYEKRR